MKVASASIASFLDKPPDGIIATLIYGADDGLVRERAAHVTRSVLGTAEDDPFRLVILTPDMLKQDPARLADEAQSLSLLGGKRVIRIRDAADGLAATLREILDRPAGDALIVMEAGGLEARSKLRQFCETAPQIGVIACYPDGPRELAQLIREALKAQRISITDDAVTYLIDSLGANRLVTRQEVEKLCLFAGAGGRITLQDAVASVGDSSLLILDDLIYDMADGRLAEVEAALTRLFQEGEAPVTILRAALRHGQKLHLAGAKLAAGESLDSVMRGIRPPIFFKLADRFRAQLNRWPGARIQQFLTLVSEAEAQCKRTGYPGQTMCRNALMRVSRLALAKRG